MEHNTRVKTAYRESEVGHSGLDVERVTVPWTDDPCLAITLLDVTFVQRTS